MDNKIVLIDGLSILNRAFYGIPNLTNSEGLPTNAVYGFLNIMFKILDDESPKYLTVAFDVSKPTFRHEMYEEYKGTRKEFPDELKSQIPLMKEVLSAMRIKVVEKEGFEADDVLGTIAKKSEKEGYQVSLVSGDRDLLQLASENIKIMIPKTKRTGTEIEEYYAKDVVEKYLVTPEEFIDVKGLMGDPSDNIPGVPGIGEKTATKIIESFGSIENAFSHIEEVKPKRAKENLEKNYDLAITSKKLATIVTDCDLDFKVEDTKFEEIYNENAFIIFKKLEFKNFLTRFNLEVNHYEQVEDKFRFITNLEEAEEIFALLINEDKKDFDRILGLGFMIEDDSCLGLSLCFSKDNIYFIQTGETISTEFLKEQAARLIQNNYVISTIDLKEQLDFLEVNESGKVFDCGIGAYLLNPLKSTYHYDDIARDYMDMTIPSQKEIFGKNSLRKGLELQKDEFLRFACYMGYISFIGYEIIRNQLKETNMLDLFEKIEMPLIFTLYDMECRGIRVNREALKEYGDKLLVQINRLEKDIYELAGETFNINSPKQLGVILFEKLNLPFAKKTKTGYSTAADILEKLKDYHPVVSMILEYRQIAKLKSTYADGLAPFIKEDERIHGKFHQTIAATGRISSTDPNLQNIPIRMELGRAIRKVFIPKDGFVFIDADYSQIELRVLAHMSDDEHLIEAYREEEDIHRITASKVFHTPLEEVTSLQRSNAKAVNFGIVYGISSFGLGQDLNISKKEAEGYINQYFATYPKIKEFLDKLVQAGKDQGFVTTIFGRRRPIPELSSSNFMQRSFGERVAMNSPIQGTAADIIKIAMIRINERLKEKNMASRLILQVHDELLIEASLNELDEVKEILTTEMKNAADLHVPLEVDVKTGKNWYEAK